MRKVLLAVAILFGVTQSGNAAPNAITIVTGGPSGIYYPLGTTLAGIYTVAMPGTDDTVQATDGSVENLKLLEAGDAELAFTLGDTLIDAWKGNKAAGFNVPLRKLRGIAVIYTNYIQIVARADSGINSVADLKGKRVSVGARGSGTALNAAVIFKAAGFTFADLKVAYTQFGTAVRLIAEGKLDAAVISAGLGDDAVRHFLVSTQGTLVPVPPDLVAKIGNPEYVVGVIPAETYDRQTTDIPTATIPNLLVTRVGVSDATAYAMTKALFQNLAQLVQTNGAARGIRLDKALVGMPIPLSPGAARYYREVGILK